MSKALEAAHDGRRKLRARHPSRSKYNPIQVQLSELQYRKLYDMAAVSGRSLSDMIRHLIERAPYDNP